TTQMTLTGTATLTASETDVTVYNNDGSKTETLMVRGTGGVLKDASISTLSGNGLVKTYVADLNGDGRLDVTDLSVTATEGSKTETRTYNNTVSGALCDSETTTVSADGRTTTVQSDTDGI